MNALKFVKNTPLRVVFLTFFSAFHLVMKHCVSCLLYYIRSYPYRITKVAYFPNMIITRHLSWVLIRYAKSYWWPYLGESFLGIRLHLHHVLKNKSVLNRSSSIELHLRLLLHRTQPLLLRKCFLNQNHRLVLYRLTKFRPLRPVQLKLKEQRLDHPHLKCKGAEFELYYIRTEERMNVICSHQFWFFSLLLTQVTIHVTNLTPKTFSVFVKNDN